MKVRGKLNRTSNGQDKREIWIGGKKAEGVSRIAKLSNMLHNSNYIQKKQAVVRLRQGEKNVYPRESHIRLIFGRCIIPSYYINL